MNALSFTRSHSLSSVDFDSSMDTSQDFESSQGGVVWVPSQSPALQALMTEAQNDRRSRPSTPIYSPSSWASLSSTTSLSSSTSSAWHSSGRGPIDASYLPPLSGGSSPASSSYFAPRGSDPTPSRRAHPLSAAQRQPLASSVSSVNRPPRHSTRPRSSSHSTAPSKGKYMPNDNEPEAVNFIDLLKDANKEVDKNSERKERAVLKKEKEEGKRKEHSRGRDGVDNHDDNLASAQPSIKNSGAHAIPSAKAPEKAPSKFPSARVPGFTGRVLTKTTSLGAPGTHLVSGKSTPTPLPSPNLNCDLKLAPAPALRLPAGASSTKHSAAHKGKAKMKDDEKALQDVIDLAGTDSEWDRPVAGPSSLADTSMYMQVDDEESDSEMDVSFFKSEPPPHPRDPAPKLKPQPPQPTRPSAPTQRAWTAPPPLGMRRGPQLQPSQYSSTQGPKGATVPRFKPPLLANTSGTLHNKSRPASVAAGSQSPPRPPCGNAARVPVIETTPQTSQDPDSSFDMSFDVDRDALEEAMKAYD